MKANKKEAREYLRKVDGELRFFCHNGNVFTSVEDLAEGLAAMDETTFRYHAGPAHCHFSEWLKDVFGNASLAEELWHVRQRRSGKAAQVAFDHLAELKAAAGIPPSQRSASWFSFF